MSNAELKLRLRRASLLVLTLGWCTALLIQSFAEDVADDSLGYVIANGRVYPQSTQDSKTYRREVQRFGGKTALAFDDFSRWFGALWQGKTLAKTVAWISALLALGIYLFASGLGADSEPGPADGSQGHKRE